LDKQEDTEDNEGSSLEEEAAAENVEDASAELKDLRKKNDECLDKMRRLQADFDNYKKRAAKEREEYTQVATARLVKELLGVVDNFERALANSKGDESMNKGLRMMYDQLLDVLRREGVTEIETDCKLDPFQHEVMTKVDDPERKDDEIVECLQKGYKMKGRVIRPARVVVCRRELMNNTCDDNKDESPGGDDLPVNKSSDDDKEVN